MDYPKHYAGLTFLISMSMLFVGCRQDSRPTPTLPQQTGKGTILADCIAHYYQQDQAPYITRQTHTFNPNTGYLQITATEPTGTYAFTLNKTQFSASKESGSLLSDSSGAFINQPLATGLFYSFTAGAGLLDLTTFTTSDAVKIEGQWYQPLTPSDFGDRFSIRLYKNMNTQRIELVGLTASQISDAAPSRQRLIRNYNLRYSKELETLAPTKMDVFDTDAGLASKQLIIQFEYKQILTQ